jgi:hypothetical protein
MAQPMNWQDVESSNVAAIGYDAATKTLGVRFKGGGTYHCLGVEPAAHAAFLAAESKGRHFNLHLKHLHFKWQSEEAVAG